MSGSNPSNKSRGRPSFKDRAQVKKRINICLLEEVHMLAKELGDGNVSNGIERALREAYENNLNSK